MSSALIGDVDIELDGTTYKMRLDLNRLIQLEEHMGLPVSHLFQSDKAGMKLIRDAIWIGVGGKKRKMSPEDIGEMMDMTKFDYYSTKVVEAVSLSMGKDKAATGIETEPQGNELAAT